MMGKQRLLWHLWNLGFYLSWEKGWIVFLPNQSPSLLDLTSLRPFGTVIRGLSEAPRGREGTKSH